MANYLCPKCRKALISYSGKYYCGNSNCYEDVYYTKEVLETLNPEAIIFLGEYDDYEYIYLALDKDTLSFGFYSSGYDRWYFPYTFKDIAIKITSEEVIYKVVGNNPKKIASTMLDEDGNIVDKYFLESDKEYNIAITLNDIEFSGFFIVQNDVNIIRGIVTAFEVLRKRAIAEIDDGELTHDEALKKLNDLKNLKNDGTISDNEFEDLKKKYIKNL